MPLAIDSLFAANSHARVHLTSPDGIVKYHTQDYVTVIDSDTLAVTSGASVLKVILP